MAHMHYKGTGKVHSFRGLLEDGGQDEINIQGSVGAIAWRITKFQSLPASPFNTTQESVTKIYREIQSSVDGAVNFGDNELLAAAIFKQHDTTNYMAYDSVIFDNAIFSRNISVTNYDAATGESMNYYIELEEVTVSATGMAQLAVAAARRTGGANI